jgi:hypothetical protein
VRLLGDLGDRQALDAALEDQVAGRGEDPGGRAGVVFSELSYGRLLAGAERGPAGADLVIMLARSPFPSVASAGHAPHGRRVVVDLDLECGQEGVQVGRHKLILNTLLSCPRPPRR